MRPHVALLLLLCGCLRENPGFDGADAGATSTTSTSTTSTSTTAPATTDAVTTGPATTTTADPTTTTTTGLDGPVTLRPYDSARCVDGPFCQNMGDPVPARIEAFECFRAPIDPPLRILRVGFEVRHNLGQPAATLDVLPFDVLAEQPGAGPLDTRGLGPIDGPPGYRSFDLDPPVLLDTRDFCLRIAGGGSTSTLALNTDHDGDAPGLGFVTMDDPGDFCDRPLTDLRDWYDAPVAHYCVDVDLEPA